ncbi:MAG: hypothetical protein M9949_05040 [Candidatus Kapabacteria bacterium]|nr:hypothetical protein [Candidatus Kapabacteria bacterium]
MVNFEQIKIRITIGLKSEAVSNLHSQYAEHEYMTAKESTLTFAYQGYEIIENIDVIMSIYHTAGHLKSFSAFMNRRKLYYQDFNHLEQIFKCHLSQPCPKPGWGCKFITNIKLYQSSPNGPYWFEFGYSEGTDIWIVDKKRIKDTLLSLSRQDLIHFCPQFDEEQIDVVLSKLPDKLILSQHPELELQPMDYIAGIGEPTKYELRFKSKSEELSKMMERLEQKIKLLYFAERLN